MSLAPIPSAASLADSPVRTDAELLVRVRVLVQRAFRRQLWFLFFDIRGRQLPILAPMDVPARPEPGGAADFAELLGGLADAVEATNAAVVYERPGLAPLLGADRAWLEQLADARLQTSRWPWPVVLVHSRGARLVADEEGDVVDLHHGDAEDADLTRRRRAGRARSTQPEQREVDE